MNEEKKRKLQQSFIKGTLPKDLDGFYKGGLELFIAGNILESIAGVLLAFWLPWYGKEFRKKLSDGDNGVPSILIPVVRLLFGEKALKGKDKSKSFVFPFQTKISQGVRDEIEVLQLDYDLPVNPPIIRSIVDELVMVGENKYLGKAYFKEKNNFRLVAFFSLRK